jgi:hypothetical protein
MPKKSGQKSTVKHYKNQCPYSKHIGEINKGIFITIELLENFKVSFKSICFFIYQLK